MYAIIKTGGKQYKVEEGDTIFVEKLPPEDEQVVFDEVLMVKNGDDVTIGNPVVENAQVKGEITDQGKDKKITVFKYKPKTRYRKKTGHRQPYTRVVIDKIEV